MARYSKTKREVARRLYLSREVTSVAEIARRLKIKPHTVGLWKKQEDWDGMLLKIERMAAEKLVEELANERVALNAQHHKSWNLVMGKMFEAAQLGGMKSETIRTLEKMANILTQAQKGQRLARGMSVDGQTEEQIRAEGAAAQRAVVDMTIEVIRTEVEDEPTRDRIARRLLEGLKEIQSDIPQAG